MVILACLILYLYLRAFVLMCLVFVCFYNCFYNCYTVLMFALLAANWHFYINKFDLICFSVSAYLLHIEYP